ncbi:MAG: hypothetical protein AAB534_03430 [Patescibacteria group bacterium]
MKTKIISGVLALVLLTIVTSTYSVLFKLKLAQVDSQKIAVSENLFEFATAATPSVKLAPTTISASASALNASTTPTSTSTTPVQNTPVPKIFLTGGRTLSATGNNIISSSNGSAWTQITASSSTLWSPRSHHSLTSFNGLMFVMGGFNSNAGGSPEYNDVYSSVDGVVWTRRLANAPWADRISHQAVSYNGKLFVMGGSTMTSASSTSCGCRIYLNDVWSSANGINWTSLGNAPWATRDRFASVVFNNRIWVMGGTVRILPFPQNIADVWSSSNGISWTQATSSAPWGRRSGHSAVAYNGKIFVMGGANETTGLLTNDVWSSTNGVNWTLVASTTPWSVRQGHTSLVFDNYMWVIGGIDFNLSTNTVYTDAWKSRNGINWTRATTTIPNLNGDGFAGVVMP